MKISPPSLERYGLRAQGLGGLTAAAAFGERAAELTPEPGRRARRALTAARAEYQAGAPDAALRLLAVAQAGPLDDLGDAQADLLRAQVAAGPGRDRDARQLLLRAARRLEPVDAALAREALRDAFTTALAAGRLGPPGGIRQVADAVLTASPAGRPRPATDLLLDGLALAIAEGPAAGTPLVTRAIGAFGQQEGPAPRGTGVAAFRVQHGAFGLVMIAAGTCCRPGLIELARQAGGLAAAAGGAAGGGGGPAVRPASSAMAAAMVGEAEDAVARRRATRWDPTAR